jgi:hypothetical protein
MKNLFILIALVVSFNLYSQDKIVFNGKPDTVFCKIKSIATSNIFYIEKGEHKSDYLRNVKYFFEFQYVPSVSDNKVVVPANDSMQEGTLIKKRQNTIQILWLIKIREKYPVAPDGYELSFVFTLPQTGFPLIVGIEPTFYVYKKK